MQEADGRDEGIVDVEHRKKDVRLYLSLGNLGEKLGKKSFRLGTQRAVILKH